MEKAKAFFSEGIVFADSNKQTKGLYDKSRYGEFNNRKVYYSLFESAYLIEAKKLEVVDGKNKFIELSEGNINGK